jgi:hypothetical protein
MNGGADSLWRHGAMHLASDDLDLGLYSLELRSTKVTKQSE